MRFGVPKETAAPAGETEKRVAIAPEMARALVKKGHQVLFERGAGAAAFIPDADLEQAGAHAVANAAELYRASDCVLKLHPPSESELGAIPDGKALICFLWPARNPELAQKLAKKRITSFSMDAIPRITRAQSMDALSSQATIAGYKAVLLAAERLPKFFPMLTTAAGTIRPAQGLVIGAGVAGLQAIATARRLGAVVAAFDARPVVKEQVLSLGATFLEAPAAKGEQDRYGYAKEAGADALATMQALIETKLKTSDFVITTAQVPGKPAPRLITARMAGGMPSGSVIVDLAAETGGNCELTQADRVVAGGGVTVLGPTNLAASMPLDASRMYARNLLALLGEITNEKGFTFDWDNEIFRETCITFEGDINPRRGQKK